MSAGRGRDAGGYQKATKLLVFETTELASFDGGNGISFDTESLATTTKS
jgi:hypothetical protein